MQVHKLYCSLFLSALKTRHISPLKLLSTYMHSGQKHCSSIVKNPPASKLLLITEGLEPKMVFGTALVSVFKGNGNIEIDATLIIWCKPILHAAGHDLTTLACSTQGLLRTSSAISNTRIIWKLTSFLTKKKKWRRNAIVLNCGVYKLQWPKDITWLVCTAMLVLIWKLHSLVPGHLWPK